MTRQNPKARRATIYDVAEAAGVSHQTVSRLIRGSSNIRLDLRARIEQAIADLNYRPNVNAQGLAADRRNVIGVLVSGVNEYGGTETLAGIREAARAAGYTIDVVRVDPVDQAERDAAIEMLRHRDFAGLLTITPADALLDAVRSIELEIPARFWREADDRIADSPFTINEKGQEDLVAHLFELGHRRFASISGPAGWISSRHRQAGLESALARRGLTLTATVEGDWSAASGHQAVPRLGRDFTALVAVNDQVALGAILALEDMGVSVPGDVSVVGFGDVPEAAYFRPPLTTVRQNFSHQGKVAFQRLLADLEPSTSQDITQLPPQLVVRRSTAVVRS